MEQYLMYLRKSRKDQELELRSGKFDTLKRHRDTLMRLAKQQNYPVACIFEEVVSGDTIAERPEMQKLLSAVESGHFAGVLVMEIPRLARGNTRDQGIVAETFMYSGTKIITPEKIYDPDNEMDEEYFEFGLFLSRREYKAINRRLQKGRMASLQEGKYIAGTAPYGYRRVRVAQQRGYTLEIVPEHAATVREIFSLYTGAETLVPLGSHTIAEYLNGRGIPSPGGTNWSGNAVRRILKNPAYAGMIRWSYRANKKQITQGILRTTHPVNHSALIYHGLHPAIVSPELWQRTQELLKQRAHPSVPGRRALVNPLAGLVRCSICGRSLVQLSQPRRGVPLLRCPTPDCPTVSSRRDLVEQALLSAMEQWLGCYVPDLSSLTCIRSHSENSQRIQAGLRRIEQQMKTLHGQQESLHDLLEQGIYSKDVFEERSALLSRRIREAAQQEQFLLERAAQHVTVGHTLLFPPPDISLMELYPHLPSSKDQNLLLKGILDHVVYSKTTGGPGKPSNLSLILYPKLPRFSAPASESE